MLQARAAPRQTASPLARLGTIQVAAFGAVLIIALLQHLSGQETAFKSVHDWLTGTAHNDSWRPMRQTFRWFSETHGLIYQEIFFNQHVKFQYPPSSLLMFSVLGRTGIPTSNFGLNIIGWAAVALQGIATALLYRDVARRLFPDTANGTVLASATFVGLMTLCFYPVVRAYSLGQIQVWLNAVFTVALLLYAAGLRKCSGALIGAMCLIKPQFGIFLLWAAIRRQWGFAAAMVAVLAIGEALAIQRFGWQNEIGYLQAISFMSRHGEAFYANQSINGMMQRLLGNGEPLIWQFFVFPPFNPLIYSVTLASSALIVGFALFWRRNADLVDFMLAALAFTIASPIAWEHHYGILPPIFAVLALALTARAQATPKPTRLAALTLFCAYVAIASFIILPPDGSVATGVASLAYSTMLYAGLMTMLLLARESGTLALTNAARSRQIRRSDTGIMSRI